MVGEKYKTERYGLLSRKHGTDGPWYGRTNYRSRKEVDDTLKEVGGRYMDLGGGLVVDFGKSDMVYDYRIIKLNCDCEVLHEETRKI